MFNLSIIIPVLNEEAQIVDILSQFDDDQNIQVIVVDGGSADKTVEIVQSTFPFVTLLNSEKGRAKQMNVGAAHATADTLLFLHGDTFLPSFFFDSFEKNFKESNHVWGRFDVSLSSPKFWAKIISWSINCRSSQFGIATGDQAIFVQKKIFDQIGGYPDQKLMEDVELSKRLLKQFGLPLRIKECVKTSSRRWEENGVLKTVCLMWKLRLFYSLGVSVDRLHKMYYQ